MRAPTVLLATACLLAAGTVGYLLRPPQPAAPAVGQVARGALEPPDAAVTAADLGLSPARELQPGQLSRSIAAPPGAVAPLPPLDLPGWISPGAAQHLALLVMEAGGDPAWPPESADADPAALHEARQMFERWFADSPLLQGYRPFAAGDFDAPRRACSKLLPGD